MNKQLLITVSAIVLILLMIGMFYAGRYHESQYFPEPTKAKVVTDFGDGKLICTETTLTIEEWYYQAKLFCSIGQCDKVGRLCN